MNGAFQSEYVRAREVLLDALEALRDQLDAVTLVGAQAIYLHTGEGELAVAPTTNDADFALAPEDLSDGNPVEVAMIEAGFVLTDEVGAWQGRHDVLVDLMVPEALGGGGRRAARIDPHGKKAARKAVGLEAALVDRQRMVVGALDDADNRSHEIWVAGPAALLVAKIHKISDRADSRDRSSDKDALDVLRLLQTAPTEELAAALGALSSSDLAGPTTRKALELLPTLFGTERSDGSEMAARAVGRLADPAIISASCAALTGDLLDALSG